MTTTKCGECGGPAVITESDRDAGAEAYCSERCANGSRPAVRRCDLCDGPMATDRGPSVHFDCALREQFAADERPGAEIGGQ